MIREKTEIFAIIGDEQPEVLLIHPAGDEETQFLEQMEEKIRERTDRPFLLAALRISDWNRELSPWEAPPVFGSEGFGAGAQQTLIRVLNERIPEVCRRYGLKEDIPAVLGGYSLAGFFSLWSVYQTDRFAAAAAVSPSVWFPGWIGFAQEHRPLAKSIYLSLGDREEKTRNRVMSTVGDCIRRQYELLQSGNTTSVLEWNEGNHFRDPDLRLAKGFAWCIERA